MTEQHELGKIPPSENLVWYPCVTGYFCANLTAPLDYSLGTSGPVSYIPLMKLPAQSNSTDGPYQGMILTNPGGPGVSGIAYLLVYGPSYFVPATGTNYDIVTWDPRGVGYSIPSATCATSLSSNSSGGSRKRSLTLPDFAQSYWDDQLALAKQMGQQCQEEIGGMDDAGQHMNTVVVVRDMLTIADAFQNATCTNGTERNSHVSCSGPALVNYWGFSYGTYIGEVFASMYPDRVGKFVLDGVLDPVDYGSGVGLKNTYLVDDIVSAFFLYCSAAGPSNCPFAIEGSSSESLRKRFNAIALQLNATEAYTQRWSNASLLQDALFSFKINILYATYYPLDLFPSLADQLVAFESALANNSLTESTLASVNSLTPNLIPSDTLDSYTADSWGYAVACTDASISIYNYTLEDLQSYFEELKNQSEVSWELWGAGRLMCAGWPITPKITFSGPYGGETKNPILFVSNTLDPVTPIANSKTWVPKYSGAQLLAIEGIGHTTLAVANQCAWEKIKAVLQDATLPGDDAYCPLERVPFGP